MSNAPPKENGMVYFQVIIENNQVFIDQVGFQVLPQEGFDNGPGFERNAIL